MFQYSAKNLKHAGQLFEVTWIYMQKIHFWNGNKSRARQDYELALLDACLQATQVEDEFCSLLVDNQDYPEPEVEGSIFETACDVIVTVAGNVKFNNKPKIVINQALTKGLLGYRLLIVRNESLPMFRSLRNNKDLQALSVGVPATWADAELFRKNHFNVVERGTLEDIFARLGNKEFDFIALGANEVEAVFKQYAQALNGLSIESSMMIYYPFPLVFYVNPNNLALASRLETGLLTLMQNGQYEKLFLHYHGNVVERLSLKERQLFGLHNALLPQEMENFSATLLA
jgi:hypothetical protein